jgi:hypothetical protein
MKYAHLPIFLLIISTIILTGCVPMMSSQIDISTKNRKHEYAITMEGKNCRVAHLCIDV